MFADVGSSASKRIFNRKTEDQKGGIRIEKKRKEKEKVTKEKKQEEDLVTWTLGLPWPVFYSN